MHSSDRFSRKLVNWLPFSGVLQSYSWFWWSDDCALWCEENRSRMSSAYVPCIKDLKIWHWWLIKERDQQEESYMNRQFTMKLLQSTRFHGSDHLWVLSLSITSWVSGLNARSLVGTRMLLIHWRAILWKKTCWCPLVSSYESPGRSDQIWALVKQLRVSRGHWLLSPRCCWNAEEPSCETKNC